MPPRKDPVIDLDLVLPQRQEELREQARDKVADRLRKKAEEQLLKKFEKEYERELNEDPNEEYRTVLIDLPGHAPNIKLDDAYFYHGRTYEVKASVYDYIMEQQRRCWAHEDEVGGANRNAYSKPRNLILGPGGVMSGPLPSQGGRF